MNESAFFAGQPVVLRQVEESWNDPGWYVIARRGPTAGQVWSPSQGWCQQGRAPDDHKFDSRETANARLVEARADRRL